MPWINCGNDFGIGGFDHAAWDAAFTKYAQAGANSVRVWVHYDANKQLSLFDGQGKFKKLP